MLKLVLTTVDAWLLATLGRSKQPPRDEIGTRRLLFLRETQKLWLAGTMGALFFAVARNLPTHVSQLTATPSLVYTVSVWLKYMYVGWFVGYFLVAVVDNDRTDADRGKAALFFDFFQAVLTLGAAYFLGFVIPLERECVKVGPLSANLVMLLICAFSAKWFAHQCDGIQRLRKMGIFAGAVGAAAALLPVVPFAPIQMLRVPFLFVVQIFFIWLLMAYVRVRYHEPSGSARRTDHELAKEALARAAKAAAEAAKAAASSAQSAATAAEKARASLNDLKGD